MRAAARPLLLVAIAAACLIAVYRSPLGDFLDPRRVEQLRDQVDSLGAWGLVLFVPATALLVAVGTPRLLLSAVAGAAFGATVGFLAASAATLLGALLTFELARLLGRGSVEQLLERRFSRLRACFDVLSNHGIAGNVLIRSAPVGNFFAINLVMALTPIGRRSFLIGSALGTAPATLVYCVFGSAANGHAALRLCIGTALWILVTVGCLIAYRRSRVGRSLAAHVGAPQPASGDDPA